MYNLLVPLRPISFKMYKVYKLYNLLVPSGPISFKMYKLYKTVKTVQPVGPFGTNQFQNVSIKEFQNVSIRMLIGDKQWLEMMSQNLSE